MNLIYWLGINVVKNNFLRDVKIVTRGKIPIKGPAIIVANHDNPWDPPLIMISAKRIVHFFTANFLFKGLTGIFLRLTEQMPVQSGMIELNKKTFKRANKYLNSGELVGIFPYPVDLIKKKRVLYTGVIKLIIENDVPVIIAKVKLNEERRKWKSYLDVNFTKVTITIGKPIEGFRDQCIKANKKDYIKLARLLLNKIKMI